MEFKDLATEQKGVYYMQALADQRELMTKLLAELDKATTERVSLNKEEVKGLVLGAIEMSDNGAMLIEEAAALNNNMAESVLKATMLGQIQTEYLESIGKAEDAAMYLFEKLTVQAQQ
jgi:hypothetical protein